jgi:uncharacterized protein YukE
MVYNASNENMTQADDGLASNIASNLSEKARTVPSKVTSERDRILAMLASKWQGQAAQAFTIGANLMVDRVNECCKYVDLLAQGVTDSQKMFHGGDDQHDADFKGIIMRGLGASA